MTSTPTCTSARCPGPIRTSILGTGKSLSVFHEPSIALLPREFALHSIFERVDRGRLEPLRTAGKLRGVRVVRTLEGVLGDEEVELVVVSTPTDTHYSFAKAALNARKHVLIEKPICSSVAEAEELYDLAAAEGLVLGVYQNRRWDSDFLTMKGLLESGKLGPLTELTSSFDRYRPLPAGYTAGADRKVTPDKSNSAIYNLGSHLVDQAITLFGPPERVAGRCWDPRGTGLDESFVLDLHYPPPANATAPLTVTLRASILSALPNQLRYLLKGSRGTYVKYTLSGTHPALRGKRPVEHEGFGPEPEAGWGTVYLAKEEKDGTEFAEEKVPAVTGDYPALYLNLFDAIDSGDASKLVVKREQVVAVLRIIELCRKSSDEGKVLPL